MEATLSEELEKAVINEDLEAIKTLVHQGADLEATDRLGQTPLLIAVGDGSVDTIKLLVELGANVNSDKGYTLPLQLEIDMAVQGTNNNPDIKEDSLEIIELLLSMGADILKRDPKDGKNAYDVAKNYHGRAQRLFESILGITPQSS